MISLSRARLSHSLRFIRNDYIVVPNCVKYCSIAAFELLIEQFLYAAQVILSFLYLIDFIHTALGCLTNLLYYNFNIKKGI